MSKNTQQNIEFLYRAVLQLETIEDCERFFFDLCTDTELISMSQRIVVAKMLKEKKVYSDIVACTGASTATISRVNRSLKVGSGYDKVFKKLDEEDGK